MPETEEGVLSGCCCGTVPRSCAFSRRSPFRHVFRALFLLVLLLTLAFTLYACAGHRRMEQEMTASDRDPETGVIRGTEALTIPAAQPVTPSTACLMIHGFVAARPDFADLGERLAQQGITVRQMRLPGHGTHPDEFGDLPEGALYKAAEDEFIALRRDYQRVYVVGFSMGGSLATILAASQPVDRLVLLAPYYRVSHKWYYILPAEIWTPLVGWTTPYLSRPEDFTRIKNRANANKVFHYKTMTMDCVRQLLRVGAQAHSPEIFENVRCPVLQIHGRGDQAASPRASHKTFERLASEQKQFVWLDNSDHIVLWDYDCEEVKRRVVEFLASQD
ncbi:alpha/beta fold hydrolase, partial [bacterium]|nr:alpha/beta fold hydrolase [bacterium]